MGHHVGVAVHRPVVGHAERLHRRGGLLDAGEVFTPCLRPAELIIEDRPGRVYVGLPASPHRPSPDDRICRAIHNHTSMRALDAPRLATRWLCGVPSAGVARWAVVRAPIPRGSGTALDVIGARLRTSLIFPLGAAARESRPARRTRRPVSLLICRRDPSVRRFKPPTAAGRSRADTALARGLRPKSR